MYTCLFGFFFFSLASLHYSTKRSAGFRAVSHDNRHSGYCVTYFTRAVLLFPIDPRTDTHGRFFSYRYNYNFSGFWILKLELRRGPVILQEENVQLVVSQRVENSLAECSFPECRNPENIYTESSFPGVDIDYFSLRGATFWSFNFLFKYFLEFLHSGRFIFWTRSV